MLESAAKGTDPYVCLYLGTVKGKNTVPTPQYVYPWILYTGASMSVIQTLQFVAPVAVGSIDDILIPLSE